MPPGRWLLAGSLALLALPAHADVADCRDSLFLDRNLVAADDFCEAAVAADPTDQEARFFRAITRLLRFTLDSDVHQLLDEAGLSEEGRDVFDFRAELPTNTLGQGVRRGTTIDFHPFTVTAGGAVGVDVLSWEQDVEDVDGDFRFDEPVDVNGDGEIAFFDAEIFVLQDDGSLDVADLVAQNDDAGLGEGRTDGSVSSLDSFLSVALAPGAYLLAIAPFPSEIEQVVAGFSGEKDAPYTLTLDEFGFFDTAPSDHGDYRIAWTGSVVPTLAADSILWLFVALADGSPRGGEIQELLEPLVGSRLESSLQDLGRIGQAFSTSLTPAELAALGVTSLVPIEIDFGDVKLLEAWLRTTRVALSISEAYDLDFDVDQVVNTLRTGLRIQQDVIDPDRILLTLRSGAVAALASAKSGSRAAIDAYLAASQFIRSEMDPQDDDLTTIEPGDLAEAGFREDLLVVQSSLDAPVRILAGGDPETVERRDRLNQLLGTGFGGRGADLHLGPVFDSPVSLRSLLPPVAYDPLRDPPNYVEAGTFPDPTFHGVLVPEPAAGLARLAALVAVAGLTGWRRQRRAAGVA